MRIFTTSVLALTALAAMAVPARGQAFADLKSALVDYSGGVIRFYRAR